MSGERSCDVSVLVVGAGPAGLTAAITLARRGVATLLVERRRGGGTLLRATAVTTRTMELLRSWGLALFTGPASSRWAQAAPAVYGPPVAVRVLDAITARTLGILGTGALMARPDGVPSASGR